MRSAPPLIFLCDITNGERRENGLNQFRRMLCLLLLVSLLFSLCAVPAYASETEGTAETTPTRTEAPDETDAAEDPTKPVAEDPDDEPTEDSAVMTSQSVSMGYDTSGYNAKPTTVPLYLQTDYPKTPYNGSSLATSGCTMACISMVSTYLTGEEHLPDEFARRFNNYEASNIQRMEAASTVMDLTYTKTTLWTDVMDALEEGKVVIVLLGKKSSFTGTQHTVVLTGLTWDGKILVNDPNGANYKKAALKEGFEYGFPPEMMRKGFSGGWIYEEYIPPEPTVSRYPDMKLTADDLYLIASIIWLEARGESFEGQQAIAEIVFNRMASGCFSDTVRGTILAEGQFRTTKFLDDAKPGELQYKAIEKAISGPNVLPIDVYFFARTKTNDHVWGQIGGHVFCYS